MAIRDRGMTKWQVAFQLPEIVKSQRNFWRDTERMAKPIIDEYETEEFDLRIAYAMEHNLTVKVSEWTDGFITDITGRVHFVDPITRQIHIGVKCGKFERMAFKDVVGVVVID
ncbi:YolD-like family protein [Bacillus sp. BRMEA1]|uniref:YolD-like family protein n=1 Tax=Neobacillus endophyticus TaxID=2738405 RepID=UPI0015642BCE|nr:YolD-like family protein [Neobacillus endophyticus]NRD78468.1 YolD-like family protein [Neobacillus endophyticus]